MTETIETLKATLANHEAAIRRLRAYGAAWALDCREMRVAQHNAFHLRERIRKLEEAANNS